jgi:hypothetical protein
MTRALLDLSEEDFEAEMRRLGLGERLRPPGDAADATERDALRARAEKAEAALAAALAVIDADLRQADDAALALRYDAAEADAAGDAARAVHLSREADRRNRARITLRTLLIQINAAIAKATKEPTA